MPFIRIVEIRHGFTQISLIEVALTVSQHLLRLRHRVSGALIIDYNSESEISVDGLLYY